MDSRDLNWIFITVGVGIIILMGWFSFMILSGIPEGTQRSNQREFITEEIYGTENILIENCSGGDGEYTYLVDHRGETELITVKGSNGNFTYEFKHYEGQSAKEYQSQRRSNRRGRVIPIPMPIIR